MPRFLHVRLPRIGRWPRLCAAGVCALLAVASALGARRGDDARASKPVVVAVRSLPAGHVVTARDVAVGQWPARTRPNTARADPADVIGRRLAGPVAAHEPITVTRLLGRDLTTGLSRTQVATPITLEDPHVADLVHPGDRVDVLATPRPADPVAGASAGSALAGADVTVAASDVVVLAVLTDPTDSTGISADGGTEIVIATSRAVATSIARVRTSQMFAVLGDPP